MSDRAFVDFNILSGATATWTFNAIAPIYFNSNAEATPDGTSSLEGTPELRLGWSAKFKTIPLVVSALVRTDTDRFVRASDADSDTLEGTFRFQYSTSGEDGGDDQELEPFLQFTSFANFSPTFASATTKYNEIDIGFDKVFNFDPSFQAVPHAPQSSNAGAWSLGLTAYVSRRFIDPSPSSYGFKLSPSLTYNFVAANPNFDSAHQSQWNIGIELDISKQWFDRDMGTSSQSFELLPVLTIQFVPALDWFPGANEADMDSFSTSIGSPKIELQIAFDHLHSTDPTASYQQWQTGPSITATWNF